MDIQQIVSIIGSLGFPIFACIALGKYILTQTDKQIDAINSLKDIITKNTDVIEAMSNKLK